MAISRPRQKQGGVDDNRLTGLPYEVYKAKKEG
jgi:hypothetical protein